MTVKAILWTYEPKKNGTCNVKIYVNIEGQKKYFKTKISTLPEHFDAKRGLVKKSHPSHQLYNAEIRGKILAIESTLLKTGEIGSIGRKKPKSFLAYLKQFITDTENGLTQVSVPTVRSYRATLKRLTQHCDHYGKSDLFFEDINLNFHDQFKRFVIGENFCGAPGFNNHIKIIKAAMRLSFEKRMHNNTDFEHKLFGRMPVDTNKIYLTEEEIKKIENLDLSHDKRLDVEKDRFLISYYLLTRYSDSIALRAKDFFEKNGKQYLRYFQQKTKNECVVPVREDAWSILKKREFDLSGDTNQESNRKLKTICAMAEINTPAKEGDRYGPKWMFVTTHTARRSAATHLALRGVNLKIIADLGGWKKVEMLSKYLRSSGLDSAEVAKDLDFFQ